LDGRSDQFSLGEVVYETLTGAKPFVAESLPTLFYQICKQDARDVEQLNPTLRPAVSKVVARAMAKEPDQRFDTCSDFIRELSLVLEDDHGWRPAGLTSKVEAGPRAFAAAAVTTPPTPAVITPPIAMANPPIFEPEPRPGFVDFPPLSRRARADESLEHEPRGKGGASVRAFILMAVALVFLVGAIAFLSRKQMPPSSAATEPGNNEQTANKNVGAAATNAPTSVPSKQDSAQQTSQNEPSADPGTAQQTAQNEPSATPGSARQTSQSERSPNPGSALPPVQKSIEAGAEKQPFSAVTNVEFLSEPPGATLTVDGHSSEVCHSPCTLPLARGRHTLLAEMAGFNPTRRIFTVPEDNSVFIALPMSIGVLVVTSEPPGSKILVDGKDMGQTPATLRLAVGTHDVTVVNGAARRQETVTIQNEQFEARTFRLQ